jgi:hypothetical protein
MSKAWYSSPIWKKNREKQGFFFLLLPFYFPFEKHLRQEVQAPEMSSVRFNGQTSCFITPSVPEISTKVCNRGQKQSSRLPGHFYS